MCLSKLLSSVNTETALIVGKLRSVFHKKISNFLLVMEEKHLGFRGLVRLFGPARRSIWPFP